MSTLRHVVLAHGHFCTSEVLLSHISSAYEHAVSSEDVGLSEQQKKQIQVQISKILQIWMDTAISFFIRDPDLLEQVTEFVALMKEKTPTKTVEYIGRTMLDNWKFFLTISSKKTTHDG